MDGPRVRLGRIWAALGLALLLRPQGVARAAEGSAGAPASSSPSTESKEPGSSPPGRELDLVVAVIRPPAAYEAHVLTLSEVELEARVALVARGGALAASRPLDRESLRAGFAWVVDQLLIDGEASRLQVFDLDRAEERAELARFRGRFAGPAAFEAFLGLAGLREEELSAVLGRTLRVERYLESRVSGAAQVRDDEVAAFLAAGGPDLPADREAARAELSRRRVAEETRGLVRDLRRRADLRVLDERFLLAQLPEGSR